MLHMPRPSTTYMQEIASTMCFLLWPSRSEMLLQVSATLNMLLNQVLLFQPQGQTLAVKANPYKA